MKMRQTTPPAIINRNIRILPNKLVSSSIFPKMAMWKAVKKVKAPALQKVKAIIFRVPKTIVIPKLIPIRKRKINFTVFMIIR